MLVCVWPLQLLQHSHTPPRPLYHHNFFLQEIGSLLIFLFILLCSSSSFQLSFIFSSPWLLLVVLFENSFHDYYTKLESRFFSGGKAKKPNEKKPTNNTLPCKNLKTHAARTDYYVAGFSFFSGEELLINSFFPVEKAEKTRSATAPKKETNGLVVYMI